MLSIRRILACGVLVLSATGLAEAVAPKCRVTDDGLAIAHVSPACPVIYDNDWWTDIPDDVYLWAKASLGQCDLRGNIVSRDMWNWQGGYRYKLADGMKQCREVLAKARESGLRGIPDPVAGADEALRRPESGRIEDTQFARSAGSDLIVAEARKASPTKPLLIFCGGPCTTVAVAYLTDPSIAERMVVFQIDGGRYNGKDDWSWQIVMRKCLFANWARGYFWPNVAKWDPAVFDKLPRNAICDELRRYAHGRLAMDNQWGDGAWVLWLFAPRCLTKVEDYDGVAVTVPRAGTDVNAMEAEFLRTLTDPKAYAAGHRQAGGEKGDRHLLCEAPEGPFRQKVPVTFFTASPQASTL